MIYTKLKKIIKSSFYFKFGFYKLIKKIIYIYYLFLLVRTDGFAKDMNFYYLIINRIITHKFANLFSTGLIA